MLDILFPRLSGGLVTALNKNMQAFTGLHPIPEDLIAQTKLQKAMVFELATARAEFLLMGNNPDWNDCLQLAVKRQKRHYDAKIPDMIQECDKAIADHGANNLVAMLRWIETQNPKDKIEISPLIPGIGWIAPGNGDFAIGKILIEVKHTNRNFVAGDFRQVLMYWLLKYAAQIESDGDIWSEVILLNPRRNCALHVNFDYLLKSASANSNRVELSELLRSIVGQDRDRS